MANASIDQQVDVTIKLLLTLLVQPRMKANEIAKMLGVTTNYIAKMLGRFREAGLDIDYDFKQQRYVGKFSEQLQHHLLGPFAKKLARTVQKASFSKPSIQFVTSLNRYSVPQFAEHISTSPQNVYNMIAGYKGQRLPHGWVAYQVNEGGRWMIVKASASRDGKRFTVPDEVKDIAFRYVLGEGEPTAIRDRRASCAVHGCGRPVLAKELCQTHYYDARRHPEKYRNLK